MEQPYISGMSVFLMVGRKRKEINKIVSEEGKWFCKDLSYGSITSVSLEPGLDK